MAKTVTNSELAAMFRAFSDLMNERHASNHHLLTEIRHEVRTTNGRVTILERDLAVVKAKAEAESQPSQRTVLKITGGTGLGILATKALEWLQK